jgi:hypothetical protein
LKPGFVPGFFFWPIVLITWVLSTEHEIPNYWACLYLIFSTNLKWRKELPRCTNITRTEKLANMPGTDKQENTPAAFTAPGLFMRDELIPRAMPTCFQS